MLRGYSSPRGGGQLDRDSAVAGRCGPEWDCRGGTSPRISRRRVSRTGGRLRLMGTGGQRGRQHERSTNDDQGDRPDVDVPRRLLHRAAGRAGPQGHEWLDAGPEAPGFFRVTRWAVDAMAWRERQGFAGGEQSINSQIIEETFAAAGAYVMGRRMFDAGEVPWGEEPPFRAPVFVVTHRAREVLERQGGTSFTFVTEGLERAIELARDAAGARTWRWPAAGSSCARCWPPGCSTSLSCTSPRCCWATASACSIPASASAPTTASSWSRPGSSRRPRSPTFAIPSPGGRSWCWTIAAPAASWSDRPSRSR